MAEVDTKLAAALRQAKTTPLQFAFVAKGASDGALFAAKTKVPAKEVNQAKSELGGGLVWRGRCFGEEGLLVFEVAKEPPSTLAKQLKTVISRDAGLSLRVEVRVNPGLAEAEDDAAVPEEAAPPEPPSAPAAAEEPAAASPDAARFQSKLEHVAALWDRLTQVAPERTQPLQAMMNLARKRGQEKNYKPGLGVLAELETRLEAALKAAPPPPADGMAQVKARVQTLKPQLDALKSTDPARHAALSKQMMAAMGSAQARKFEAALALLDQVEAGLKEPAATPAPAAPAGDGLNVLFTQCRLVYDQTRKKVQAELQKLEQAIIAACTIEQGYDPGEVADAVKKLYTALDGLDTRLIDTLDEGLNATDPGKRRLARESAAVIVDEYLALLDTDPVMSVVDDNGYTPVTARKTAVAALTALAGKL